MSQNESRGNNPSQENTQNTTNQEDLASIEAAMKEERRVSTPKLTTFSAVIDEVMPQIQEQRASLKVSLLFSPFLVECRTFAL